VIGILNEQTQQDQKVSEVCRKHGISEATFYNWRSKYAGMKVDELKRLKELEYENARLKKIVANQSLIPFQFNNAKFKSVIYIYNLSKLSAIYPQESDRHGAAL